MKTSEDFVFVKMLAFAVCGGVAFFAVSGKSLSDIMTMIGLA